MPKFSTDLSSPYNLRILEKGPARPVGPQAPYIESSREINLRGPETCTILVLGAIYIKRELLRDFCFQIRQVSA